MSNLLLDLALDLLEENEFQSDGDLWRTWCIGCCGEFRVVRDGGPIEGDHEPNCRLQNILRLGGRR